MFFSFDGLDGVGKTTQIDLFVEWLTSMGRDVVHATIQGALPWERRIREILLGHQLPIARSSEMLLFMAARAQLVTEVVRPALERGQIVVSDRFLLANVVYQGYAGGLDVNSIWRIGELATAGIMPDRVFVLDMPPPSAAERIGRPLDRMEVQGQEFQSRLRQGFLAEAAKDPGRIVVVDAARNVKSVQEDIQAAARCVLEALNSGPTTTNEHRTTNEG